MTQCTLPLDLGCAGYRGDWCQGTFMPLPAGSHLRYMGTKSHIANVICARLCRAQKEPVPSNIHASANGFAFQILKKPAHF